MKALLFFILGGIACADLPRMTIEHGSRRQDLRVDEVRVTVRVEGDFVDTRMSLNFFNETDLNQEGEFRLPLPEGASVNHYALEVNGKMRAATTVEKEQARHAYETIKALNIDPGLVEKMEGNIYRTRIFPVLPKQGKRVSIGYVQPLQKTGEAMVYRLPFGVEERVGNFILKIEGDLEKVSVVMTNGAELNKSPTGYSFTSRNSSVEGDLLLTKKIDDGAFFGKIRAVDGEHFAYLSGNISPELEKKKTKKPESLTIIWDASATAYSRDLKAEFEFLQELTGALGNASVRLLVLHRELVDGGEFQVKGGKWQGLRVAIEEVFHDGAADWRKVGFHDLKGDRVLVFGGGTSAFPISQQHPEGVLQIIRSGALKVDEVLAAMAEKTGGDVIDLRARNAKEAVSEVLRPRLRVVGVEGPIEHVASEVEDGRVRIFAKLRDGRSGVVNVSLGRGNEALIEIPVIIDQAPGGRAIRYLWAHRMLDELIDRSSLRSGFQEAEIISHCKAYGLVSDFTSLIVLERMEDHVKFRIPPPEPELMAAYERGLQKRKQVEKERWRRCSLDDAWSDREEWYRTDYPWMEVALYPRYMRVRKWTEAQISVFEKEQLAQTNLAEFLTWQKKAEEVMKEGREVAGKRQYAVWSKKVEGLLDSGKALGREDAILPEQGEFGVSVRGLVVDPKTINMSKGASLKQAIDKAGGIHFAGSASRVALYRSGKRSIYNLLSERYVDVNLLPGDMVVVMSPEYYGSDINPFDASGSDAASGEDLAIKKPAVVEGDAPLESILGRDLHPFGGGWDSGPSPTKFIQSPGAQHDPKLQGQVKELAVQGSKLQVVDEILAAQDPWKAYQKRRAQLGDEPGDFAQIAKVLYERNEKGEARRVLSNLHAGNGIHVPSWRAVAYWMIQFKDYEGAGEMLSIIGEEFPDDALLVLDLMRLHRIAGSNGFSHLDGGVLHGNINALAGSCNYVIAQMAMMERNRFQKEYAPAYTKGLPESKSIFPSDIRIVVSSSDSDSRTYVKISEPSGETLMWSGTTLTGARLEPGAGVAEFMVRRALPGDYTIQLSNMARATCQVEIFLHWGSDKETRQMVTLSSDGKGGVMDGCVVTFEFGEE